MQAVNWRGRLAWLNGPKTSPLADGITELGAIKSYPFDCVCCIFIQPFSILFLSLSLSLALSQGSSTNSYHYSRTTPAFSSFYFIIFISHVLCVDTHTASLLFCQARAYTYNIYKEGKKKQQKHLVLFPSFLRGRTIQWTDRDNE